MGKRWLPAAIAVLAMVAPTAAANLCEEWVESRLAPHAAGLSLGFAYEGQPAREIRQQMDGRYGNGDGFIQDAEKRAYARAWNRDVLPGSAPCFSGFDLLRLDGNAPRAVTAVAVEADTVGASQVDTGRLVRLTLAVQLSFAQPAVSTATAQVHLASTSALERALRCLDPAFDGWPWADHPCGRSTTDGVSRMSRVSIQPEAGTRMIRESLEPEGLVAFWVGTGLATQEDQGARDLRAARIQVVLEADEKRLQVGPGVVWGAAAVGGVLAAGVVLGFRSEAARFRWWLLVGAGYTRIRRENALRHPRRKALLDAIREDPGACLADLQRRTGLAYGAIVHHLRVLEGHGHVRRMRDGIRLRFFLAGEEIPEAPYLSAIQRRILAAIRREPGATQQDLAHRLQVTRDVIAHNGKRLESHGFIETRADGRWRRYHPSEQRHP